MYLSWVQMCKSQVYFGTDIGSWDVHLETTEMIPVVCCSQSAIHEISEMKKLL